MINVDWKHVNAILNTAIAPEEMVKMLDTINIPAKVSGEKLVVTVPHYRVDIEQHKNPIGILPRRLAASAAITISSLPL